MTIDTSHYLSQIGRRGATTLTWPARSAFGLLGLAGAGGGVALLLRAENPEIGGTAIVIIGAIFLLLAVIGRLPKSLEVSGVPLEYEQNEMAEFISTIRGTDLDDATVEQLLDQLQRMSANAKLFKSAKAQAAQTSTASQSEVSMPSTEVVSTGAAGARAPEKGRSWIEEFEDEARVSKNHDVVQENGRGRPPRVDYYVEFSGGAVVVGEQLTAWNATTLGLVAQRLQRVFANDEKVKLAVVTVPRDGKRALEAWYAELEKSLRARIIAAAEDDVSAATVRDRLRRSAD